MLQKLSIQNYAIIEKLDIEFSGSLNIITGETGAGKSIIAGALSLILGQRADLSVLVNKESKCIVEGVFDVKGKADAQTYLTENDFESGNELIIRREVGVNGKSRAFINDTPVNLSQLCELSSLLVDLHQQFDTLNLGESSFQRRVLDALAGNADLLSNYQQAYSQWQRAAKEGEDLKKRKLQFDKESDYNQFQFSELEELAFKENELEEIDKELKLLGNVEGIKTALNKVYYDLAESDNPVVQQLKSLSNLLQPYSSDCQDLAALLQRLLAAHIEMKDIAAEVDSMNRHINYDPVKIEQLTDRLSLGYKLLKKHNVKTTAELLTIKNSLEKKLQAILNIDTEILEKEKAEKKIFIEVKQIAEKISESRKKQIKPFEEKVNKLLLQVGMPNAKLKAEIKEDSSFNSHGRDSIEFLFDANKSGQFQPVNKIASGGELSRLMLCIKSLVAQSIDLPTLIFDEIDAGISGEAAKQVGIIMKELGAKRQVISITHQPQIAGKADTHFFVYKEIVKDSMKTSIRQLTSEERIMAIAKMLSGEEPTAAAMENAREMLGN